MGERGRCTSCIPKNNRVPTELDKVYAGPNQSDSVAYQTSAKGLEVLLNGRR